MKSFQTMALEKIAELAERKGFVCSISQDWENTGNVNIHVPDEIIPIAQVRYSFESTTYTLAITIQGRKIPSQPGRADYFDFYQDTASPTRFWDALGCELGKVRAAPRFKGEGAA